MNAESESVEFKPSLSQIDNIVESVSAFSNTKGGRIEIGKDDSNGSVIGVAIGKRTIENLANDIKQNTDPPVFPSIEVVKIDGKDIIIISVKESPSKPVLAYGRAFKRVGRSSHKLGYEEIRKLAAVSSKIYWDGQICKEASLDDIDSEKIKWFLRKAKAERNYDVDPETPIKEALEKLELMKDEKLTNAAVLMFGKNPQRFFIQSEVRCARFKGMEPLEFIDMKVFRGNIIDQRDNALEFVKEHIQLHAKIIEDRVEKWEYPIPAIREAISNAICHRDYETSGNVQVRIFDDRVEIWGCGHLPEPLTVEDLKKKHRSIPRNHLIAENFFLVKYIEQWGTGTNRIIEDCLNHGLPEPLFEDVAGELVVTFRKYRITDEILKELNEREKTIVNYIKDHGQISRKECVALLKVSPRTAFRYLNSLKEKNIIVEQGRGKSVVYVLK
ncbi:MAG: helix-turn-helix domain-containing protein [Candidatus Thermoplasmatota archaeon]|nr:helix-turn-helix domain-containing protein [Candidatus Thermoplasmatota archaeon]